jgi:type II restriction enzyme
MMVNQAKAAIDSLIAKSRVHLYKPIQIAEILYRDRVHGDVDLLSLETYRTRSKGWRDVITNRFVGRSSNSSAKYQDNVFEANAMPSELLSALGKENKEKGGIVEAYIYRCFTNRFSQMASALEYCDKNDRSSFDILEFINLFWMNPGLKRSIDKIYEIVVYALFSTLVEALEVQITVTVNENRLDLLAEFQDFTKMVMGLTADERLLKMPAKIYRVGVTNAADRGLDMYANFGMAIQIKHLSLTPELAEGVVGSITADRIVIVCRQSEEALIVSLLNQIGWRSRIQSIITEANLHEWYKRSLRGTFGPEIGNRILLTLKEQIIAEFPASNNTEFAQFYEGRGYNLLIDDDWV